MDVGFCPECGVPDSFRKSHTWLNNGEIVSSSNHAIRLGFIECENLDPLFRNIGGIIDNPIDDLVVTLTARGTEVFMRSVIPEQVKEMVLAGQMDPRLFLGSVMYHCQTIGFGKYEFVDARYEKRDGDYSVTRVEAPFSVPEAAGCIAGVASSLVGGEHSVTYEAVSPGLYEFTTRWTEYPEERKERLKTFPYQHRDGDLELERCATCGMPASLANFSWHIDKGLIVNNYSGRRMSILGPELLDILFSALEDELGDAIPGVIVEAQRCFAHTGFYSIAEVSDTADFRSQLALRGMGNLREIDMGGKCLRLRIDNAAGHLLIVGIAQGLFELVLDIQSNVDWELSADGTLQVEVKPQPFMMQV